MSLKCPTCEFLKGLHYFKVKRNITTTLLTSENRINYIFTRNQFRDSDMFSLNDDSRKLWLIIRNKQCRYLGLLLKCDCLLFEPHDKDRRSYCPSQWRNLSKRVIFNDADLWLILFFCGQEKADMNSSRLLTKKERKNKAGCTLIIGVLIRFILLFSWHYLCQQLPVIRSQDYQSVCRLASGAVPHLASGDHLSLSSWGPYVAKLMMNDV